MARNLIYLITFITSLIGHRLQLSYADEPTTSNGHHLTKLRELKCPEGFGPWKMPSTAREEAVCDEQNILTFKNVIGFCLVAENQSLRTEPGKTVWQWTGFDGNRDGCVTCEDYRFFRRHVYRLFSEGKRRTDASLLKLEACAN